MSQVSSLKLDCSPSQRMMATSAQSTSNIGYEWIRSFTILPNELDKQWNNSKSSVSDELRLTKALNNLKASLKCNQYLLARLKH